MRLICATWQYAWQSHVPDPPGQSEQKTSTCDGPLGKSDVRYIHHQYSFHSFKISHHQLCTRADLSIVLGVTCRNKGGISIFNRTKVLHKITHRFWTYYKNIRTGHCFSKNFYVPTVQHPELDGIPCDVEVSILFIRFYNIFKKLVRITCVMTSILARKKSSLFWQRC